MTIVFIHGAGCLPHVFEEQLAAFPDALAVNLPGHGKPGEPATVAALADAVAAELHSREIDHAILAGSSLGGAVALDLALRHDPRVAGLIMLGSSARLRVAPSIFESIREDFDAAAVSLARNYYANPSGARVDWSVAMMRAVGAEQLVRDFAACDAFDVRERLGEIDVPLLALTGENDVMTPPKFAEAFVGRVPRAMARIVPGGGHLVFVERPEETNDAIRTFVTSLA